MLVILLVRILGIKTTNYAALTAVAQSARTVNNRDACSVMRPPYGYLKQRLKKESLTNYL